MLWNVKLETEYGLILMDVENRERVSCRSAAGLTINGEVGSALAWLKPENGAWVLDGPICCTPYPRGGEHHPGTAFRRSSEQAITAAVTAWAATHEEELMREHLQFLRNEASAAYDAYRKAEDAAERFEAELSDWLAMRAERLAA